MPVSKIPGAGISGGSVTVSQTAPDNSLVIDSSGNVGVGTNSPLYSLDVQTSGANARFKPSTVTNPTYVDFNNTSGNFYLGIDNSAGSAFGLGAYSRILFSGGAYPMVFVTNSAERMRIDSSGNVGIGTSSPTSYGGFTTLAINNSSSGGLLDFVTNGTVQGQIFSTASEMRFTKAGANFTSFYTNGSERMRIKAAGGININSTAADDVPLQIGGFNTTLGTAQLVPNVAKGANISHVHFGTNGDWYIRSASSSGNVVIQDTGGRVGIGTSTPAVLLDVAGAAYINSILGGRQNVAGNFHLDSNGGACYINFFTGNGLVVGNGTASGLGPVTASAFNVSDRNEKENIEYFNTGLAEIMQLKPAKFDMKQGQKGLKGFIAQDVQPIMPEAIGTMRRPDLDVDVLTLSNTALFPYLVAAIQEQQAIIEELKARIETLEAK